MENENIDRSDLENLCRVCLAQKRGDLICFDIVVQNENCNIGSMLKDLVSTQIQENDSFPQKLCERCVEGIYIAYTIKKQAIESGHKLLNLFKTAKIDNPQLETDCNIEEEPDVRSSSSSDELPNNHEEEAEADADNDSEDIEFADKADVPNCQETCQHRREHDLKDQKCQICYKQNLTINKTGIFAAQIFGTRCCGCKIDFDTENQLLEHSKSKHFPERVDDPSRKYECSICYKRYVTKTSLNRHNRKKYLNSGTRKCRKLDENRCCGCKEKFETSEKLKDHSDTVHLPERVQDLKGSKPIECPICYNRYSTEEAFGRHKRKIYEEKFYKCSVCSMSFVKRSMLRNHERKYHVGLKQELLCGTYQCTTCGKTFLQPSTLKNHEKIHLEDKPFKCSSCGKGFSSKGNLQTHEKLHIDPSDRRPHLHECPVCNVKFKTANYLEIHHRVHTGEKPYRCEWCDKLFAHSAGHKRHLLTHTGHKPHVCRYCNREFANRSNMLIHEKGHLGEKNATCDLCGKTFVHSRYMKKHRKRHFMEKNKIKTNEIECIKNVKQKS